MRHYLGVDIGGTNLVAGVTDEAGRLLTKAKTPTAGERPAEALCADILRICAEAVQAAGLDRKAIDRIGIGVPGSVDEVGGNILYTANAPLSDTPIRSMMQTEWDVPIHLGNDANCAALGEYCMGAAKAYHSMVMVTLGTGIGGGAVIDGRLLAGFNGAAMEIGHIMVERGGQPCNCGRLGCWEQYASATALIRMTRAAMEHAPESAMWKLAGALERVDGRVAFDGARQGDLAARQVVDTFLDYLAIGITDLVNIFQPQVICLGGGISNQADDMLLNPLRTRVEGDQFTKRNRVKTEITRAVLGNDAGIIGAAMLE